MPGMGCRLWKNHSSSIPFGCLDAAWPKSSTNLQFVFFREKVKKLQGELLSKRILPPLLIENHSSLRGVQNLRIQLRITVLGTRMLGEGGKPGTKQQVSVAGEGLTSGAYVKGRASPGRTFS